MFGRFDVAPTDLLGAGGESEVYALDDARVLRIYKPGVRAEYVERRRGFYDLLAARRPPFELPVVLEGGRLGDRLYTVERRMPGRVFAEVLPTLRGADRERALASYLSVAEKIGEVCLPDRPFGEIMTADEPVQRDSWPEFLWERLQQSYRLSQPDLERDVPDIGVALALVRSELRGLEGFAERRLVHGDYFPGNVYVDDELEIRGVGDFGYSTVVGDPRLDLAGAIAFLEVVDGHRPEDTAFVTRLARERHETDIVRWLDLYRLYYSFYFSTCKVDDPPTYAWCVRNLTCFRHSDQSTRN